MSFNHPDEIVRGQGFMVLADRRVFAVMAFLNAVGLDEESPGKQMHPVRVRVRELVAANLASCPDKVESWRRHYETHKLPFYCYQDFALSLSADYPFRRIRPDAELGYAVTAEQLRDFPVILNDFWRAARVVEVWQRIQPDYAAELRKYDVARMTQQMAFLWEYLRMPRHDTLTLVNVPNLLDMHYRAIGARYEGYYYTVESPGSHSYGLNIHEYLHSIINPIVEAHSGRVKVAVREYYEAGKDKPMVEHYRAPVGFTYECLVRALDHRLRALLSATPESHERAEARMAQLHEPGLTLSQPFYRLLTQYEQSDQPFDRFFPTMLERLPEYRP
ncbi:hypothetical protein [Anaerobaca lacustris]|uniref:DUF4932 domain-containing protein n=1 Tax=Anaerobaca lacustris TaxID=3044600 RepID=A0AAW6U873_9BACT|nr:hypothetical protein [Sedimentisphaerales bacterium M17dextr]